MAVPAKPRLKRGETPQSPSFQKRMREWQRAVALAEATAAKKEQDAREAAKRAKRDVLEETKSTPKRDKPASTKPTDKKSDTEKPEKGIHGVARIDRAKTIREAVEGGIEQADDEEKRKRKK